MEVAVTQVGNSPHIVVRGEVDERGAEELKHRFGELKLVAGADVVFDFGGVTHIGSAGIGKLLLFYKTVASIGGTIQIERATATIVDLFQQLKLDTIFTMSKR
jgi:anti-sigma B factor antagonist